MTVQYRAYQTSVLFLEGLKFQFEVIFYPGAYDLLMDEQECVLPNSSFDRGQEDGIGGGGFEFQKNIHRQQNLSGAH